MSALNPDRPGTGTYSLQDDCTGTMTLLNQGAPPLELRIVVVDKGREVRTAVGSACLAVEICETKRRNATQLGNPPHRPIRQLGQLMNPRLRPLP